MNKVTLHIHSFIDIITNSSTEIYVSASQYTVDHIKQLVDAILKLGNSDKTCDDLFMVAIEDGELTVELKPDVEATSGAVASTILSRLTSLFDISGEYNG